MPDQMDSRVQRLADQAGVIFSTHASTKTVQAVWKLTGSSAAEARLLVQIIGRARLSSSIRDAVRPGLDDLITARPELEVVRILCDGESIVPLTEQQGTQS